MGITIDFLVKHVRPLTEAGYEAYCSAELLSYLLNDLQLPQATVTALCSVWRQTAKADPQTQSAAFSQAAAIVSEARWAEWYPTKSSTLLFLDANQLRNLSLASEAHAPHSEFDWLAPAPIAIVVTKQQSGATHILWGVNGCRVGLDANGHIIHFCRILS